MSCAFLWQDKSRAASVTTSGVLGDGAASMLADPQPRHRMRLSGTSAFFIMDLGAMTALDCFALISTTLEADSTIRARVSDTDPAATSSLVYDSTGLSGITNDKWLGQVVLIAPAQVSGRYLRWDLTVTSGASIVVGLAPCGPLFRPTRNYAYGAARGVADYGVRESNVRTGAMFGVAGAKARVQQFALASLAPAEVESDVKEMDRLVGNEGDVLWIPEASDPELTCARDAIWGGFRAQGSPLTQHDSFNLKSRAYLMTERL